jgi:hypothetical protein
MAEWPGMWEKASKPPRLGRLREDQLRKGMLCAKTPEKGNCFLVLGKIHHQRSSFSKIPFGKIQRNNNTIRPAQSQVFSARVPVFFFNGGHFPEEV